MIKGIGVDLIKIERMRILYSKYGSRLVDRVLCCDERTEYKISKNKPEYLSSRFSVKEAFSKALGIGLLYPITFQNLSVNNNEKGQPILKCKNEARHVIENMGIKNIFISITHEKEYLVSMVVLEL